MAFPTAFLLCWEIAMSYHTLDILRFMHTCSYGMTCPKKNRAFPTAVLLFWKFAMSLSTGKVW